MPETLITTPFGFESTAAEVIAGIDLTGKRAIVTGGSSGIGIETARALAGAGAEVTLAVRDTAAGERTANDIDGDVRVGRLDLADQTSVKAFAARLERPAAHPDQQRRRDGAPRPAALARGLGAAVRDQPHGPLHARDRPARGAEGRRHRPRRLAELGRAPAGAGRLRRPALRAPRLRPGVAYAQSKTANVLFAVEAQRRWGADGITVNAVHPGAILESNLARHIDPALLEQLRTSGVYRYKTLQQGAATSVLVATWPPLDGQGGHYFEHGNEAPVVDAPVTTQGGTGVAAYAIDPANAERLWEVSEALIA